MKFRYWIATALAACTLGAHAQEWPARPVRIINPFPAGGSSDVLARMFAQALSEKFGQQFVVENRSGAAGNLGTDAVAKAAPDGYTLAYSTSGPLANNKLLYKSMPYDPEKAFTPIVLAAEVPLVIATGTSVPAKNLKEFVELARANPGRNGVGHPGNGTIGHLALELMKLVTRTDMLAVAYKGDVPAMTDLLSGAIQATSAPVSAFIANIQAGKLNAVALTSKVRFSGLPNVPTAIEQGYDIEATVWSALVAPAGTPRPVIDRLSQEMLRIINSPEGRAKIAQFGAIPIGGGPDRLAAQIAGDTARWRRVIESAKITVE